ncbi:hypothetical protein [Paraburkholderia fungorum]|uniref:Uncharacterized protein n=1 Tax=Paraburkholderia fungorum TaxID=134537 RepID=A0A420FNV3_9BURK|nr:hypothetical protein [Paraburkholderia fungorum]RKF34655.1 hypothetical protein BCY88_37665 [Paraburkholderia fungorum]
MDTLSVLTFAEPKVLIVGIANEHSIIHECARPFRELGAELSATCLNNKAKAYVEPHVRESQPDLYAE